MLYGVLRDGVRPYRGGEGDVTHFCKFSDVFSSGRSGRYSTSMLEGVVKKCTIVADVDAGPNGKLLVRCVM
jgi:hypothetical protein